MTMARCFALSLPVFFVLAGCSSSGGTGALAVTGSFDGEASAAAELDIVVMECPFKMPPVYSGNGVVAEGGAHGEVAGIEAGQWCVQTFIDMDPEDGLMPVQGLDATAALDAGAQSIPVSIRSGETTEITVAFEVAGGDADGGVDGGADGGDTDTALATPGADDVWVRATIDCPACDGDAPVVFYGYAGDTPGTIPDIYDKIADGVAFPMTVELKETGAMSVGHFVEGHFIVAAYQDLDNAGMGPEDDEPISDYATVDLVKGEWNEVELTMEL
jgi:hypothetical protein